LFVTPGRGGPVRTTSVANCTRSLGADRHSAEAVEPWASAVAESKPPIRNYCHDSIYPFGPLRRVRAAHHVRNQYRLVSQRASGDSVIWRGRFATENSENVGPKVSILGRDSIGAVCAPRRAHTVGNPPLRWRLTRHISRLTPIECYQWLAKCSFFATTGGIAPTLSSNRPA
jgi:hypothetical protein